MNFSIDINGATAGLLRSLLESVPEKLTIGIIAGKLGHDSTDITRGVMWTLQDLGLVDGNDGGWTLTNYGVDVAGHLKHG